MRDTEFTPGPWRLGYGHAVVADSTEGLTIRGSTEPEYYGGNMIAESVAPANCHLISAAPELYEEHESWSKILGEVFVMLQQENFSEAENHLYLAVTVDFSTGSPIAISEAMAKARGEKS
jgi:hypothetical protein